MKITKIFTWVNNILYKQNKKEKPLEEQVTEIKFKCNLIYNRIGNFKIETTTGYKISVFKIPNEIIIKSEKKINNKYSPITGFKEILINTPWLLKDINFFIKEVIIN